MPKTEHKIETWRDLEDEPLPKLESSPDPLENVEVEIPQGVKETVIDGLVETLTQYMRKTKFKGHYRLEPLNGRLFAIKEESVGLDIS